MEIIIPHSVILEKLTSPVTLKWCGGKGEVGQAGDIFCKDRYGCSWVDTEESISKNYTLMSYLPDGKVLALIDVAQDIVGRDYHIVRNGLVVWNGRKDDTFSKFRCGAFFIITRGNSLLPIRVNLTKVVTAHQHSFHYD